MQLDEAKRRLEQSPDLLQEFHITRLRIFGSTARGESNATSDIDMLVDFERPAGFFHLARTQLALEELLGTRVDLVTEGGLHPALAPRILADAIDVIHAA